MISGVLYALLAGLMWGLIFVGPLIVPEYPAMLQSMGRYLALGLIALPIAWLGRVRLRQLARRDWLTALMLTMMGNLIYYFCLASAIQRTGAPVSTMIIGTLPVVIPVFANLLLADEINRATPRTQASLLECMAEGQVTVDGQTRKLEEPFFVIATENPVETLGCFPLPEAQLDRFLMKLSMGGLSAAEERTLIDRYIDAEPLQTLQPVCTREEVQKLQAECRKVFVHEDLRDYIVRLVQETRKSTSVGVSPRGTLALLRASQGLALVAGRDYVVPEDIKKAAVPVLAHRLLAEDADDAQKAAVIKRLLEAVAVPTEDWGRRLD